MPPTTPSELSRSWSAEARRRGAGVDVIDARTLAVTRPDVGVSLICGSDTALTSAPAAIAARNRRTSAGILAAAGIPTADASEQDDAAVCVTVVDGIARSARLASTSADVGDSLPEHALLLAEGAAAAFPGLGLAEVVVSGAAVTRILPGFDSTALLACAAEARDRVLSSAVEALLRDPSGDSGLAAAVHDRLRTPEPIASPTTSLLLAAELEARGFAIERHTDRLFHATKDGAATAFRGSMSDRTSSSVRDVLARPHLREALLAAADVPVSESRRFGASAREKAWEYVASLGEATLRVGAQQPVDVTASSRSEFDEAWADRLATIRSSRAVIARRAPGIRFSLLVAEGRVLGALRTGPDGAAAPADRLHRSYLRLAADAARAFPGADVAQVVIAATEPRAPARPGTVTIEHVEVDPDLVPFHRALHETDPVRAIIDLHLGAPAAAAEPAGTWREDSGRATARLGRVARRARAALGRTMPSVLARPRQSVVRHGLRFEPCDGGMRVVGWEKAAGVIRIPHMVAGREVVELADGCLRGNAGITNLTIPPTVERLGTDAVRDCAGLVDAELPPTLSAIGSHAFSGCTALTTVTLPTDLVRIGERAFAGCAALTTLQYFTAQGERDNRRFLRSIVERALPQRLEAIEAGAFDGCRSLTEIAVPHRVTRIPASTFDGCAGLERVLLHAGVERIDGRAFGDAASLAEVRVPDELVRIASDAFSPATALACVSGSPAQIRCTEIGQPVRPVPADVPSLTSAYGARSGMTVADAVSSPETLTALEDVYGIRPTAPTQVPPVPTQAPPAEHRGQSRPAPRLRWDDGRYVSTRPPHDPGRVTLSMVGDLMCGTLQQRAARRDDAFDFTASLSRVADVFRGVDLALANLETMASASQPLSHDRMFIDGRPHLNAPRAFLEAVGESGIDVVLNAQNHAYDTGVRGIMETLVALNDTGLVHGGLYAGPEEPRPVIIEIGGMTIGVVAFVDPRLQRIKRACFTPRGLDALTSPLEESRVRTDIEAARTAGAEFVLAYCHWGAEYTDAIGKRQARFARMVADAGADYIFGAHSHCPQPRDVLATADGRNVPVVYSGGNFLGRIDRHRPITFDTFVGTLTLARDASGAVRIVDEGYLPCRIVEDATDRGEVVVVPIDELDSGGFGYDPATAVEDRMRIAAVLGDDYREQTLAELL